MALLTYRRVPLHLKGWSLDLLVHPAGYQISLAILCSITRSSRPLGRVQEDD